MTFACQVEVPDDPNAVIAVGAPCLHKGCKEKFKDDKSRVEPCLYHPGAAVFHEGSKYWSCCKKGCLEFEEMLRQPGCSTGKHKFVQDTPAAGESVNCKVQSYQTPAEVCLNVFAKNAVKEKSSVVIKEMSLDMDIIMKDQTRYKRTFNLPAPVDPEHSSYVFFGTKVEVMLRKKGADNWGLSFFK